MAIRNSQRAGYAVSNYHLLVRSEVNKPLLTPERADDFMRRAVALAGMNIIAGPYSVLGVIPGNEGVSSTVILDFSSANLHEWGTAPQPYLHFDLFTCGNPPDLDPFYGLFAELEPIQYAARLIDRDKFLRCIGD